MKHRHVLLGVMLALLVGALWWYPHMLRAPEVAEESQVPAANSQSPEEASRYTTVRIAGEEVRLVDGVSVRPTQDMGAPVVTRYFGNAFVKDMAGDGRDDVAFLLTEETGGSGTFFYVAVAVQTDQGYEGSEALYIGDRIAPQSITDGPGRQVVVNYADRALGEPFTTPPSVGKSLVVMIDPVTRTIGEVVQNFEGESVR